MQEFILLVIGLIGLWIGTNLVIKGALNIANHYELSQVFVGVVVMTIDTDLPEMVIALNVSLQNVLQGVNTSGIIIGNAIGSSFSQINVVMGISCLLGYLTLSKWHLKFTVMTSPIIKG